MMKMPPNISPSIVLFDDPDVARLHVRIAVVHDDAEVAVRIFLALCVFIDAGVSADFAIVKAIEVETFSVDLLELIVAINRLVHIARGIHRYGYLAFRDPHPRSG